MGDDSNYFGKRRTPCGKDFNVEILIRDSFPTFSARLGQQGGKRTGQSSSTSSTSSKTSSPNIVPTPTPPTSHIPTGAQPSGVLKAAATVRGWGASSSQQIFFHSMRRASVKPERAALRARDDGSWLSLVRRRDPGPGVSNGGVY